MSITGKKIYVFNNASWGKHAQLRQDQYKRELDALEQKVITEAGTAPSRLPILKTAEHKKKFIEWLEKFARHQRTDQYLQAYPENVDIVAALAGNYWTVGGSAPNTRLINMSASISANANKDLPSDKNYLEEFVVLNYTQNDAKNSTVAGSTMIINSQVGLDESGITPNDTLLEIQKNLVTWHARNATKMPSMPSYAQTFFMNSEYTRDVYQKIGNKLVGYTDGDEEVGADEKKRLALKNRYWNYTREKLWTELNRDRTYYNYNTAVTAPFTEAEMDLCAGDAIASSAKADSEYNFYCKAYENYSRYIPEKALPNIMLAQAYADRTGDQSKGAVINSNLTLGGTDAVKRWVQKGQFAGDVYWQTLGLVFGEVMNLIGSDYADPSDNTSIEDISRRNAHIGNKIADFNPLLDMTMKAQTHLVYTGDYNAVIEDARLLREMYPMHVNINFNTHQVNQFADHMYGCDMMPSFVDHLIGNLNETGNVSGESLTREMPDRFKPHHVIDSSMKDAGYAAVFEAEPKIDVRMRDDGSIATDVRYSVQAKRRLKIDLETFIARFIGGTIDTTELKGRLHVTADTIFGEQNTLERQLKSIIAAGNLKDFIQDNVRTHEECMNGKLAYNEVLAYRVTKYDQNDVAIQNYWFGNSSKISDINFVDTQVRYGQTYTYRIFAYTMIIGTKYNYLDSTLKPTDMEAALRNGVFKPGTETFWDFIEHNRGDYNQNNDLAGTFAKDRNMNVPRAVFYRPCLEVVETQIFAQRVMTYDSPPVVPEFQMVPYKGKNDKLLLLLKGAVARQEEQPITITVGDASYGPYGNKTEEEVQTEQALYQDLSPGDPMLFESDDRPEWFEVFRTTEGPYSWEDWADKLYARVSTLVPSGEGTSYPASEIRAVYADSASLIDTLVPNTKYYYMARQVDVHGNPSNPTPMYEVELVDENGMVYPVIREYQFRERVPSILHKKFNKYIKIAPTPAQVLINTDTLAGDSGVTSALNAANGNVQLGVSDTNLWGKQFKVRITSETTGKAADINLNFKQEHKMTLTERDNFSNADSDGVTTSSEHSWIKGGMLTPSPGTVREWEEAIRKGRVKTGSKK